LYAIKDNNTAYGDPRKKLIEQKLIDKSGTTRTTSTNKVDFTVDNGWYVDFNPGNTTPGERVNIDPQLVLGTLVVQSNIPNNNACTVGGDSFLYQFDYASGQYVSTATGQIVAQKTYGQIAVGNAIVRTTTGVIKAEQSFSGGQPPVSTGIFIGSSKGLGRRVSWRELLQ
jgi:type IV pilus assembly protein PilY1